VPRTKVPRTQASAGPERSPVASAPGPHAPRGSTGPRTCTRTGAQAPASPPQCRRQARAGDLDSKREAGAPGGAGARERRSCIRFPAAEAPPSSRPPLLPRAGSARPKPRACARLRRPGPSGGGPVDSNESVGKIPD
jgi:hypothetical protein